MVLYARPSLESCAMHLEGHPAPEDLRDIDAKTFDASLIIPCSRGRRRMQAVLSGSPSNRVTNSSAPAPLLWGRGTPLHGGTAVTACVFAISLNKDPVGSEPAD